MATAMAAVEGRSSWQISCADSRFKPSCIFSSVLLARRSMASDWRARTESGSIERRITSTIERVNMTPAVIMMGMLWEGASAVQRSVTADSTAIIVSSISTVNTRATPFFGVMAPCALPSIEFAIPLSRLSVSPIFSFPYRQFAISIDDYPRTPTSFSTSMTAATIRKHPNNRRSVRSGTFVTSFAPMTAPGMVPMTIAIPAR